MDVETLKLITDLRQVVEANLGPPDRGGKWLCPFHEERTASFHVFVGQDGVERFNCFGCEAGGDVIDFVQRYRSLDFKAAVSLLSGHVLDLGPNAAQQVETIRRERQERARVETETALTKLATLASRVETYHAQVAGAMAYWLAEGLTEGTVDRYRLGYCQNFLVAGERNETAVIPYFCGGRLVNLRHRLLHPNGHGKYRPEFAGLPNCPFNLDCLRVEEEVDFGLLDEGEVLVVEGEKKAMVLDQIGFRAVGLPGLSTWQDDWAVHFRDWKRVYVALDDIKPTTQVQAGRLATSLKQAGLQVRLAAMPCKPDDYFVRYGGNVDGFANLLAQGRLV